MNVKKPPISAEDIHSGQPTSASFDERIALALEEYVAGVESGERITKDELLARYPDVANELADCLGSLDFIHEIAPQFGSDEADPKADDRAPIRPLATLGDFRILREIGRGGMGVVYEAEQLSLGRRMALKVLPFAAMLDKQHLKRFHNEARAAATLDHPNIVAVHSVGEERGVHYYAMQLIEGQSVAEAINQLRGSDRVEHAEPGQPRAAQSFSADTNPKAALSTEPDRQLDCGAPGHFRTIARLGVQAAEALEYSHSLGIVHRDIKPSNLLIASVAGTRHLWITDFGLAQIESEAHLTKTGDLVGTLRYMSPEQAAGHRHTLDHRTDVYSLGITLYELATLQPAFAENDRVKLLKQIFDHDPPAPSIVNPLVPKDLETIILKATAKDPSNRYESAQELADDLGRLLDDQPIVACRPSAIYRARKFMRRHRAGVMVAIALLSLLLAGILGTSWGLWRAIAARDAAIAAQVRETAAKQLAQQRSEELKQVTEFQASMLRDIDPETMGRRLLADIKVRIRADLEQASAPAAEVKATLDQFDKLSARLNGTDLARTVVEKNILAGAVATIDSEFADKPLLRGALSQTVASIYQGLALYEPALKIQQSVLSTRRLKLGNDHPDTLESISEMGKTLLLQGKYTAAEPYLREALASRRRVLGDEHPDTLASLNDMGYLLQSMGKLEAAKPYYDRALRVRRRVLGSDDPQTLESISNMGFLLGEMGQLADAERCLRECLKGFRRVEGNDHPDTLTAIHNLAELLSIKREYVEAERYCREALEGSCRVLGCDHPDTLASINNLAGLLDAMEKPSEAEPYFRKSLEGCRRMLGNDHPQTLWSINNMGYILHKSGKHEDAESYYREALELGRRVLGPEHADTLYMIHDLTGVLISAGKLAEAEPLGREAVAGRRHVLGDEHPQTLASMNQLGRLLILTNQAEEAESIFAELLETARRVPAENRWIATALASLATAQLSLEQYSAAEVTAQECLGIRQSKSPQSWQTFHATSLLGAALAGQKKFTAAEPILLEGYQGLQEREKQIPAKYKHLLTDVPKWIVALYEGWEKPDKAASWKDVIETAESGSVKPNDKAAEFSPRLEEDRTKVD